MKVKANKKTSSNKIRGLGKGLDLLMNDADVLVEKAVSTGSTSELPIDVLVTGIAQPRKHFSDEALDGLTSSIIERGILQPLLVRPLSSGNYEIIAGERRYRASKRAGLSVVPVAIMNITDKEAHEIALIENIQREDLTPIEEAEGYRRMMDDFTYTQNSLSSVLGKSRSHIANTLRLLSLPEEVKSMLDDGHLTTGHARTLIGLDNAYELALEIANRSLSVRETERFVSGKRGSTHNNKKEKQGIKNSTKSEEEQSIINSVSASLGRKIDVAISSSGNGKLTILFDNEDDLKYLVNTLTF